MLLSIIRNQDGVFCDTEQSIIVNVGSHCHAAIVSLWSMPCSTAYAIRAFNEQEGNWASFSYHDMCLVQREASDYQ